MLVDSPDEGVDDRCDFGKESRLMFDAIQATGERFGLGKPIAFLAGSVSDYYYCAIYASQLLSILYFFTSFKVSSLN